MLFTNWEMNCLDKDTTILNAMHFWSNNITSSVKFILNSRAYSNTQLLYEECLKI